LSSLYNPVAGAGRGIDACILPPQPLPSLKPDGERRVDLNFSQGLFAMKPTAVKGAEFHCDGRFCPHRGCWRWSWQYD